jgi:intracellular sulfur oxidation DsrE/DsrF family protein
MSRTLSIVLVLAALVSGALLAPKAAAAEDERLVYHLTRLANARVVLDAVEAHLNEPGRRRIAIVAHGGGVRAMVNGAADSKGQPLAPVLRRLAARDVDLVVCGNSLDALKIDRSRVIVGRLVPSGSGEIERLLGAGYREVR